MSVQAGDVKELTLSDSQLGSVVLYPVANEEFTLDLGGLRNEDNDDNIDGGGRLINQKNWKRGFIEGPVSNDDLTTKEQNTLSEMAAVPRDIDVTVQHINGSIYAGTGQIVGDIQANLSTGQIPLKIAVPKFRQIA